MYFVREGDRLLNNLLWKCHFFSSDFMTIICEVEYNALLDRDSFTGGIGY